MTRRDLTKPQNKKEFDNEYHDFRNNRSSTRPIGNLATPFEKKDFTLKNLKQEEFQTCLALASLTIPSSQILNEKDVNQALKHWLNSTGSILWIDHVELRRTLIDYGFLHRNLAGTNTKDYSF